MKVKFLIVVFFVAFFNVANVQCVQSLSQDYFTIAKGVETPFEQFNSIEFDAVADVNYRQGEQYSVRIECPDNMIDHIKFLVEGQKLKIKANKKNTKDIIVYITSPDLYEVEFDGVGNFRSIEKTVLNHDIKIDHDGVGNIKIENLECQNCKIDKDGVGSSYFSIKANTIKLDVDGVGLTSINVDCESFEIEKDGVGNLTVSGYAGFFKIDKKGVGNIDSSNLIKK